MTKRHEQSTSLTAISQPITSTKYKSCFPYLFIYYERYTLLNFVLPDIPRDADEVRIPPIEY